jgi:hypothetical protein
MARDNAPKERNRKELERKRGRRASYDRILIVSEGKKTEPNYFHEIRSTYRLHTANVQVRPSELGTSPLQVVQYARELFTHGDRHKGIQPRAFEKVFAVFDRDDHDSYKDALNLVASLDGRLRSDAKQPVSFQAIASVPCFELWLLLHYEDIQAPLHRNDVMRRLRSYIPDYQKGMNNAFATTKEHLAIATERAERLAIGFSPYTDPEPYTGIGELVKLFAALRGAPIESR